MPHPCALPTIPVAYPPCWSSEASVVSLSGRPLSVTGLKTPGMPMRGHCRPVSSEAREHEQTGHAEYHEDNTLPSAASLSIWGVELLGWPLKPTSP
eukprot:scaffold87494_cov33-Tisochrysis_lutea.AAC.1